MKIVGVDCPTCVYAIEKRVRSLSCVRFFNTEVSTGTAEIEYDDKVCVLRDLYKAIRDAGYDIYKEKLYFDLRGFSGEERAALESRILKMKGILDVRVSSASGVVTVLYNPLETTREEVANMLRLFGAELITGVPQKPEGVAEKTLLYRRLVSFSIGLSIIVLSMYAMLTGNVYFADYRSMITLLLATAVAITLNYDIIVRGFKSFLLGTPIMDSLIAVSSISTFAAGTASLFGLLHVHGGFHESSFFEASAGVIGFVGLGKYLEERLRRRAFKSLENLITSLRGKARVVTGDTIVETPVTEVRAGDVVEVKAGEVIPVDGVVIEGLGYVDESSFTGEPVPRIKRGEGRDSVLAGSFLYSGYLRVRATRVGDETLIAHVIESVREAESLKPRLARLADRLVGYFTWVVLVIALVTLTYWWVVGGNAQLAVMFMAAVLTVACPCALGIATPLVISIAVLKSSRTGLLVRAGEVFEKALNSDTVVFDKTGTLTVGKPRVLVLHVFNHHNPQRVLELLCTIESRSEHPLSRAVIKKCEEEGVKPSNPDEYVHIPGEGIFGLVNGVRVAAGNLKLASRLDVSVNEDILKYVREIGLRGNTPILIMVDSRIAAILEIGDELKEGVTQVIKELKGRGYRVGLASGDVESSVKYYKDLLELDFAYWGLRPNDKAELIRDLQTRGRKIVFVGDGINDAPALSTAYLGVAMGGGAEISKEAGDAVILSNDLRTLLFLLNFSRVVKKKILQNIAWAFIYNIALIPLATGAFYTSLNLFITPELAAAAMILSDISVIINALTILKS